MSWPAPLGAGQDTVLFDYLDGAPERLDPAKCSSQRCQRVMWAIYEPLVNLSADSRRIVPGLAESWEVSPDGLSYTFRLRRGVRFHDGATFDAQAAKVSLERNFVKTSPFYTADSPNVREEVLTEVIQGIVVRDAFTLGITLKSRRPYLLALAPVVSPLALEKHGVRVADHPAGTGPFKFERSSPDEIRLAANRDYWDGRPKIDVLAFRIIPQAEKRMQEFLDGRVDIVSIVEPVYLERIMGSPIAKQIRVPVLHTFYLGAYLDRKPFSDVRVRRALIQAIDRDRAVPRLSRLTADPAHGPLPPGVEAYNPKLPRVGFDPGAAAKALTAAGITPDVRVSLLYNKGWGFMASLAQAIQHYLGKVGLTVDLVAMSSWPELVAAVRRGQGDLFIYGRQSIFTDPVIFLGALFQTGAADNLTRYSNPKVDTLLKQAASLANPANQLAVYRKVEQMVVDDAAMVFLYHEHRVSAYNTRVTGLELNLLSLPVDRFSRLELR